MAGGGREAWYDDGDVGRSSAAENTEVGAMGPRAVRAGVTSLMAFYGAFAAAGAAVPWYFNIRHMRESGELLTPQAWLAGGFVSPLAGSITSDFLIGTTPVLVWMVVEARRLGMRRWWFYVVTTFLVAFAFSCPLFLLMREVRLRAIREATGAGPVTAEPSDAPSDLNQT